MIRFSLFFSLAFMLFAFKACDDKTPSPIELAGTWQGTGDFVEKLEVIDEHSQIVGYEEVLCEDSITIEFDRDFSCSYCKSIFDKDRRILKKCFRLGDCKYEISGLNLTINSKISPDIQSVHLDGRIINDSKIAIVERNAKIVLQKVMPTYN